MPCVTTTGSTITRRTIEESDDGEVAKQKSDEVSPTDDKHTPKHKGDDGGKRSRRDVRTSFVQQRTAPRFNAYHTLLSVEKSDSESLDSLINRVDKHIRVIKSLSPSSFTLDNLYDELAVMAIIRVLPHFFDDIMRTISILDKFDKPSVIQSLRNMDQTHINLSSTSSAFAASSSASKCSQSLPTSSSVPSNTSLSPISQNRGSNCPKCDFSSCLGHVEAKCFLKEKLMRQIPSSLSLTASLASTTPQC